MKQLLSTKEVARYLDINEKMVYNLIAEKRLPATKVTGKWLFPRHLVDLWVENHTVNYPDSPGQLSSNQRLLIISGSNDLLMEKVISLYNKTYPDFIVLFGNIGSLGGIKSLKDNLCHIATSHLLQADQEEYNFDFANDEFDKTPVIINFCQREQGILLQTGNPKNIRSVRDLGGKGIRVVNRAPGTGTRLLFDKELSIANLDGEKIDGYQHVVYKHLDVGLEILSEKADAGPGIKPVASLLGLEFIPIRWERYDLLMTKEMFFDIRIQQFIGLLHDAAFETLANQMGGYNISISGKMVYPKKKLTP